MSQLILTKRTINVLLKFRWLVAASALSYVVASQAQAATERSPASINLQTFLDAVSKSNAKVQAAKLRRQAATLQKYKSDLQELSPMLLGTAGLLDDGTQTNLPAQQGTNTSGKQYSLNLSKAFATGTTVTAGWSQGYSKIIGTQGFTITPKWESKYQASISQSLWKNSLGFATRLRHESETVQERMAILKAEGESRQALIDAEDAYWAYVMQTLDVQEKADSLRRVQKTRDWTAKRLSNGIADRADLLQVESLLTKTKLGQLESQNKLVTARKSFFDALGVSETEATLPTTDTLSVVRPLASKTDGPQRLDIWIQAFAAKAGEIGAKQAADLTKPDLSVNAAFAANARDPSLGTSSSNAFASDHTSLQVGIKLAMSLDFGLQSDIKAAANAEAKAARMIADKLGRDASSSWNELVRQHQELSATIELMEQLSKNLEAKLKREQERLELGRTITANVVNFEQELADASLMLLKTKVAQRKLEALSRMYLSKSEVEAL